MSNMWGNTPVFESLSSSRKSTSVHSQLISHELHWMWNVRCVNVNCKNNPIQRIIPIPVLYIRYRRCLPERWVCSLIFLLFISQYLMEEVYVGRCACSPLLHPAQRMKQGPASMLNEEGLRERWAATPTQTTVDQKAAGRLSLRPRVDESGCQRQCLQHVLLGVLAQAQLQIA